MCHSKCDPAPTAAPLTLDSLPQDAKIAIGVVLSVLLLVFGYFGLRYNLLARLRGGLERTPYHPANIHHAG